MSRNQALELFAHGSRDCDLAVVEGVYHESPSGRSSATESIDGGSLDKLCEWLALPRLAVLDATTLGGCLLPALPRAVDGLLLDNVDSPAEFFRLQTSLEALWGIPVVGGMERLPEARAAVGRHACVPGACDACRALATSFGRLVQCRKLVEIAHSRPLPCFCSEVFTHKLAGERSKADFKVAVAFDEAFHCYFTNTLDLLEFHGATIVDFSPLDDESLPRGVDLVYLGCGRPELFATRLADNHCMAMALREHVCAGRRIYAEGGGLAYLCQNVEAADGRLYPMLGVLPAVARRRRDPVRPQPVEVTLAQASWLAPGGVRLRGYRNANWTLEPLAALASLTADSTTGELDLVSHYAVVGSRVHLDLATQPALVPGFLRPSSATAVALSAPN